MNSTTKAGRQVDAVRVNGRPVEPVEPWSILDIEPATGQPFAEVVGGQARDAANAVDAAHVAFESWSRTTAKERASGLRRVAAALRETSVADELATVTSRETGKRVAEGRAEVGLAASFFEWFAEAITTHHGQTWDVAAGVRHEVIWKPLGVVAAITPWNFPVSIPARKIAPALAAGCAVVFRPSEVAPLAGLRLAEIIDDCLPAGVVNTLIGPSRIVADTWLSDPRLRGLTFTGSIPVGQALAEKGLGHMIRFVLELGGKAPFVVLDDVDLAKAVSFLAVAKYRNNGQSCIAADQVWVPRQLVEEFTRLFVQASESLVIGNPLDEATSLGPLAKPTDPERISALVRDAEAHGASVIEAKVAVPTSGHFVAPAICVNPPPQARIVHEEIFGPVAAIRTYDEIGEAIAAVRESPHGLGGYVAGTNIGRAAETGRRLSVGIVGINTATPNTPQIPFAGLRLSGMGVEGSELGLEEFMTPQSLAVAQ